jgi:membrane protease YdiL (CAAX protease family)
VLIVGFQTRPPVAGLLLMAGLLATALGLALGAGYQVVARSSRPAAIYRGPSPLLAFGVFFLVVNAFAVALVALGLDLSAPLGVVAALTLQVVGYFGTVWMFAVRSGALGWRDLDLGRPLTASRLARDVAAGAGLMFPATFGILIVTALIFTALNVQPPEVVPTPRGALEALLIGVAVVILVPIGEELFFRGFALNAWLRDLGERSAVVRSALFFALFHIINIGAPTFDEGARQALGVVLVIVPIGLILGVLYTRRGLFAAMAAHATYNGLGYVLSLLAESLPPITPP